MNPSLLSGILLGEVEAGQSITLLFRMDCHLLYIPETGFKLMAIPLPQSFQCWDYRCTR